MMQEDFYKILGVEKTASDAEIKKSYRNLARELHPDTHKGDKVAEERFKKVSAAYAVLSDKKKRKLYDEFGVDGLRDGFNPEQWRRYGGGFPGGGRRAGGSPFGDQGVDFGGFSGFGGMEGIFETLFGGRRQGGAGRGHRQAEGWANVAQPKGPQIKSVLEIDLLDAVLGRELAILIPVDGQQKKLTVTVPKGVQDGKKIRLKGQGGKNPMGGESGDLILELKVRKDSVYKRDGYDLEKEELITIGQAYFGDVIEVETPWGKGKLKIPEGTQGGRRLRIKGQGVRTSNKNGDLYVRLHIKIPQNNDKKTIEIIKKLEKAY